MSGGPESGLCAIDHTVSADDSANTKLGGSGTVVNWKLAYVITSWTPQSGSPWDPPPAGFY
jgi:hypothetical protein